ncbi:hypothetical protein KSC_072540 [Ktedonobacter sp. SOSP1-52]|nr:hypothetical protein KSC_072540 [Ktedonobacter sp. SOSP1-52]
MRNRFDLTDYAILAFIALCSGIGGIVIGTFLIGPQWYVSHNCLAYPFLLLDPHQYIACKIP